MCHCAYGHLSSNFTGCEDYSSFVVFSNQNRVESVRLDKPLDPNPPFQSFRPLRDDSRIVALAYDPLRDRIFFSDLYLKPYLYSVHLNGSGLRAELKETNERWHIEGLALDPAKRQLFWTESSSPSLWSMIPGKSPKRVVTLSTGDKPRGIVFHFCLRRLYWTNWNLQQPGIETCISRECSSTRSSVIATHSRHANALSLYNELLFWSESSPRTDEFSIHSCKLDGTGYRVHIQGSSGNPFALLVLPDQRMLWTDFLNGRLCLSYKSEGCRAVRRDLQHPLGLIVVRRLWLPDKSCTYPDASDKDYEEPVSLDCFGIACNSPSFNKNESMNESFESQSDNLHTSFIIGVAVAGTFLLSISVALLTRYCCYIRFEDGCLLEKLLKRRSWIDKSPLSVHRTRGTPLLEMDNVLCQKDVKPDDEWGQTNGRNEI